MSRGPGELQRLIIEELRESREPLSVDYLRRRYALRCWALADTRARFESWCTPPRRRSIRMSMGRALRQLEAAGQIKRDDEGEWYPAKDWTGRDHAKSERLRVAHHEAGHAVIGLALKLPIAFVTIKRRAHSLGHVSRAPVHHGVGEVYARGNYRKPIADLSKQDAFGNPVTGPNDNHHADIVMTIAGGMAEIEFLKAKKRWNEMQGTETDRRIVAHDRRKLGDKAPSIAEYEAECAKLIKQHWPMIEAVAAKLIEEETLSGHDVYSICWRTSRNVVRRQHLRGK
jgi:hypothetical protein